MIFVGSLVNIIDNSGASRARCIHIYRKTKKAKPGDTILVTIRKSRSNSKIKKGQLFKAIVAHAVFKNYYRGGHFINCDTNGIFLLKKNGDVLGTRFFGPICQKIFLKRLSKALSLVDKIW